MKLTKVMRPEFMAISPFDRWTAFGDDVNRLFGLPLGELDRSGELFHGRAPALDLREDNDNIVASVELPGMKKGDIDVSLHDGVLSISGERNHADKREGEGVYRSERTYGRFHRTVSLPKPVQVEAIQATYKDGVLTITMPKTEEAKPRRIEVKIG